MVFADFDHLPDGLNGHNGPVVQSKEEGKNKVHQDYLTAPEGMCDIFFPTDFKRLLASQPDAKGWCKGISRCCEQIHKYTNMRTETRLCS